MDISTVSDFVTSVGFPVVMALLLLDQNRKTTESYSKLYHELKETIDNNSRIIKELVEELRTTRK